MFITVFALRGRKSVPSLSHGCNTAARNENGIKTCQRQIVCPSGSYSENSQAASAFVNPLMTIVFFY
ncbi:hypothetical protein CV_0078 [Chromobacterium violaceum ATCC 12472]|uniref:Uncharacterized protein n=1 Tax=Chromobacterium violaceum (strain ATCC 12472 / DSM 30191 / JCM 1249 / CCUG 213 / NBRC 12614 / NCIMB 9131 / NCTC 9757 / MK) TaxID=243365 RepID=Q7P1Y4_CHRVO|nr:hypothetical protein CV_0078 [Chromobacterium violaceum ATCC 12472]